MRGECIKAVENALGRSITQAESRKIESRIAESMRKLARDDPQRWQTLSADQRLTEAADFAAKEIAQEASLKKFRIAKTIIAHDRTENYTNEQVSKGLDETKLDAFERLFVGRNDGKNNVLSVESQIHGNVASAMSRIVDLWEAIHPKFFGIFRNKESEAAMYLALHGDTSVDPKFVKAAKDFHDLAESFRERFNNAGGNIGKLEDWGAPHSWSDERLLKAGKENFVSHFMQLVDKSKYVHDDGRFFSEDDLRKFLGEAWNTIVTDGANKPIRTDIPGGSIKANRHSAERQIHFKDARSALEAHQAYSDKNVFGVITGHIRSMARDIALIETLGPNSDLATKHFVETYVRDAINANPAKKGKYNVKAQEILNLYDHLAGNDRSAKNKGFANAMSDVRNWFSAVMLGSAPITAIADEGTLHLTAKVNQIPQLGVFRTQLSALNPLNQTEKALAYRAGLMVETMIEGGNRFAAENVGPRFSSRVSGLMVRLSGLIKLDEMRRRSLTVPMLDQIGSLTRSVEKFSDLQTGDHKMLAQSGITERDWQVYRMADVDSWGGDHQVMTADTIFRIPDEKIEKAFPGEDPNSVKEQAATRLLGFAHEQANMVVPVPGAKQKIWAQSQAAGTWSGEMMRAMALFRSFPLSYFERHFVQALGRYDTMAGKAGWIATIVATQTILGAVAMEVNDVISGKNPRALVGGDHLIRNWLSAFAKGGALGIYGDFLFSDPSSGGPGLAAGLAGPMGSFADDADKLTRGNILKFLQGQKTSAGAESVRFARRYLIPGANLWYAKAALDHLVFHEMQEYFAPGYLARSTARAGRLYGTTYWLEPGEPFARAKAPNLETLAMEK